jgi:hypothetical protein
MSVTHSDWQSRANVFPFRNAMDGQHFLISAAILKEYEKTMLGDEQAAETGPP